MSFVTPYIWRGSEDAIDVSMSRTDEFGLFGLEGGAQPRDGAPDALGE